MGLYHFFFFSPDIVSYTAGYFSSFYWDENKNWLLWNEMQLMKWTLLLRANVQKMENISRKKQTGGSKMTKPARCFSQWEFTEEIRSGPFLVNPLFMS